VQQWFNTAAFAVPAAGYFGSAAPGSIPGPGTVNFDMALYKDFRIKGRHTIEFRAECSVPWSVPIVKSKWLVTSSRPLFTMALREGWSRTPLEPNGALYKCRFDWPKDFVP
jgi:hypothetical protein